jgi:DNA-binding IclR family transcriptional regulator
VHLAVPNGASMVYIEKLESPSAVRMASRIGTSVCLHATAVGKAYLAMLGEAEREALVPTLEMDRYTPRTLVDRDALRAQLAQVRERGWSFDDEEHEAGIQCFGAAIVGEQGTPVAAISVTTLRFRQKDDMVQAYVQPLLEACRAISERICATPSLSAADLL